MKLNKNKKYSVLINTSNGLTDEFTNVELFVDDIFIRITLDNGSVLLYPICNIERFRYKEFKED